MNKEEEYLDSKVQLAVEEDLDLGVELEQAKYLGSEMKLAEEEH